MANTGLKNIFLSASIPLPERDQKYLASADIIAIRDAIIALTTVILPEHRIIWGGHPSITPLIYYVMEKRNLNIQDHVRLYQSKLFEKYFPEDNNKFENVYLTEITGNRDESLQFMREKMFSDYTYDAAIFIGGMEGVEAEYKMFAKRFPRALLLPLASTGGAAAIIYNEMLPVEMKNERFVKDFGYMSVFQKYLLDKI